MGELVALPVPDRTAIDAQLALIRAEIDRMFAETQAITIDALLALPAAARAGLGAPPDQID